jgi:hypothetical protein
MGCWGLVLSFCSSGRHHCWGGLERCGKVALSCGECCRWEEGSGVAMRSWWWLGCHYLLGRIFYSCWVRLAREAQSFYPRKLWFGAQGSQPSGLVGYWILDWCLGRKLVPFGPLGGQCWPRGLPICKLWKTGRHWGRQVAAHLGI